MVWGSAPLLSQQELCQRQLDPADVTKQADVRRGLGCSMIFRHEEKDLVGVVHGDRLVFGGSGEDLRWGERRCWRPSL